MKWKPLSKHRLIVLNLEFSIANDAWYRSENTVCVEYRILSAHIFLSIFYVISKNIKNKLYGRALSVHKYIL
jgi:hypothetical protein